MDSNYGTLTLKLDDRLDDEYASIDAPNAEHYAVASVVVRMEEDSEDRPELVELATNLVNRYNQHNELTSKRDQLLTERNATGVAIDDAIRGRLPEQHPMLNRLQMIASMAAQRDEFLKVIQKYEEAFDLLFGHCASNGVFNAWGKPLNCTALNEAHGLASKAIKCADYASALQVANRSLVNVYERFGEVLHTLQQCRRWVAEDAASVETQAAQLAIIDQAIEKARGGEV